MKNPVKHKPRWGYTENKPKVLWVAEDWKGFLRLNGEVTMYAGKELCEIWEECKAVKIKVYIS